MSGILPEDNVCESTSSSIDIIQEGLVEPLGGQEVLAREIVNDYELPEAAEVSTLPDGRETPSDEEELSVPDQVVRGQPVVVKKEEEEEDLLEEEETGVSPKEDFGRRMEALGRTAVRAASLLVHRTGSLEAKLLLRYTLLLDDKRWMGTKSQA